ncbi:MAG: right-handed parallel beta-helix repeat-containing protein, partial [Bacteroidales bacterium]|nr:right-handed parallel beta-helix repeat-containing protein [Bacteroidales bacterium]
MRNLINRILVVCMGALLFTQTVCSQTIFSQSENFDGNTHSFTSYLWEVTTSYSRSHTKSMAGYVPNISGDSVVLTSPSYNLGTYDGANVSVVLKFNHICKVSPQDIARIEYRIGINSWEAIPVSSYMGTAANYAMYGFNAENYPKWKGEDSTATPSNGWWQEEIFDISSVKGNSIQIRFVLKHGNITGSQVSYGWLIDDVGIYVSERPVEHPFIQFLGSYPINAVYRTGPYDITVEAKPNATTKASLKPVYLKYTSLYNNVYTIDSVLMNNADGDTMWTASIPQFREGTNVTYSITATDTNANSRSLYGGYAIKRLVNTPSGYVIAGTGQTANNNTPVCMNSNYGWSRQLYLAEEIEPIASAGGIITKLAWECTSENINVVYDRQTCYFQAVDNKVISNKNYENPVSVGAEQVWTGSLNITQGWVEITLDKPFLLLPEQNLVIHWVQKNGMHTAANWAHTVMPNTMCVYANNDIRFPSNPTNPSTDIVLTSLRPNARFYLQGSDYAANSTAILSMTSPTQQSLQPGIANNVEILIRNTGSEKLDSVTVNWTVNGGTVNSIQWYGNLSWDNQTTVSLNSFIPRANMYDSILVWLDMPNGVIDSTSWDDTLLVIFYGCSGGGISGSFTVGNGGNFANLDKAMEILDRCGANGNLELQLKNGIYTYGLDFQNFGDIMNGHRLIITSEAKNKDSVIFRPSSNYGVKLGQSKNITLEYLTFDLLQAKMHGIFINDTCSNITVNHCAVLCDTVNTSQSFSAIYKTSNTGILQHIQLTNNFINGGYRGIELDAGTSSQYGSNITIEGNTVKNANESNIYIRYADNISIANNKILARSYGSNFYWYGIYASGISGNVQGNKINQQFAALTSVRGIYIEAMNQNNSIETGMIANNEVILDANKAVSTAYYYGIYVSNPNANLFHNSIFISNIGGTNPPCGIKIEGGTKVDVQNNNVVIESINGRPLEMPAVNQSIHNFKSNNFYAPRNMARIVSTDVPSADLWQSYFPADVTSISKLPAFIDNTVSLELSNYNDFLCTKVNNVSNDINNTVRGGTTSMGAYTQTPFTVNAMLTEVIGWQPASGQGSTLKLVLLNDGTSTINSANINWTFNNSPQNSVTMSKTLQAGESDTISLGNINYANGMNELKAWISQLGSLTDEYKKNDTLQMSALVCGSMLNGIYTIGATGNFKTINEAVNALYTCGISGSVTFTVENGIYPEIVQFPSSITGSSATNTVTFISVNGDAQATVIQRKGATSLDNATLILNGVSNLTFKQITIDGRPAGTEDGAYFHAVRINSGCNNIEIDSCILINPLNSPKYLTTASYAVIYTPNGSILNNIRILNNTIKGGSHGIYIYGASGTRNKNIFIENNLISMVDNYGMYLYYNDSVSIYSNTITQRIADMSSPAAFSGIYCYYFTGNIIKNRIYADLSLGYGIYIASMNNVGDTTANPTLVANPALIANNEIRGYATGTNSGIYVNTKVHANIYHNSVLINGTGIARGLFITTNNRSNNIRVNAKNNNFAMMTSANDFPIYLTATSTTIFFLQFHDIDYNNYYSQKGAYVGYAGGNKTTLSAWQATMTGDLNSVVEKTYFVDATNTLQPASNHGL